MSAPPATIPEVSAYQHSHVVPRGYLNLFAFKGMIVCHFTDDGRVEAINTSNVAVRKNIYAERMDDGCLSNAVEQAMGPSESSAIDIFQEIEAHWPLDRNDRATLAEYLGLQVVRGPAWMHNFEEIRRQSMDRARRQSELTSDAWKLVEAELGTDRFRLETMMGQIAKMGSLLGSMHWSLLRFGKPRLLTSDHPVAPVPLVVPGDRRIPSAVPQRGFMNTVEFLFPVTPCHALVLSWRNAPDGEETMVDAPVHMAKSINGSVRAQAQRQWFHSPEMNSAGATDGQWAPLSFELHTDYDLDAVLNSERRRRVNAAIEEMVEANQPTKSMQLITVTRREERRVGQAT